METEQMKLPTILGKHLLTDAFKVRMVEPDEVHEAIASYQRMCLVGSLEDAWLAAMVWFRPEHRRIPTTGAEHQALLSVHSLVKQDVLGIALDSLIAVTGSQTGALKDKITAAALINELLGEKELIKNGALTDKLVISLVEKG